MKRAVLAGYWLDVALRVAIAIGVAVALVRVMGSPAPLAFLYALGIGAILVAATPRAGEE